SPVGSVVGNLSTIDAEAGDAQTYTLVSGTGATDNASFEITGGALKVKQVFDFETKSSYSVRIRSTDAGGLSYESSFTITVSNVNEAPTGISLSALSIGENSPVGSVVGNLSTI